MARLVVLLVDDHALVRAGLRQLLAAALEADVREAADAPAALALLTHLRPDVVVLDLGLPGAGGLTLMPRLRQLGLPVLILSMHAEPIYAERALQAGALGYLSKNVAPAELLDSIRRVAAGKHAIEPRIAQLLAVGRIQAGTALDRLTPRDLDVLRLLAAGSSLADIGAVLGISYKTVANTASLIRAKLGVSRTADLIRLAVEMHRGQGGDENGHGGSPNGSSGSSSGGSSGGGGPPGALPGG